MTKELQAHVGMRDGQCERQPGGKGAARLLKALVTENTLASFQLKKMDTDGTF